MSEKIKSNQKDKIADWTKPDKDGIIHIPDELDKLFNRIGFQVRLITISGLNEVECIARMVKGAQEHAEKEAKDFTEWIRSNGINLIDGVWRTETSALDLKLDAEESLFEQLYKLFKQTK